MVTMSSNADARLGCLLGEPLTGVPEWIVHVSHEAAQHLTNDRMQAWNLAIVDSVGEGGHLDVKLRWLLWVLANSTRDRTALEVTAVADLLRRAINGDEPTEEEWAAAEMEADEAGATEAAWATEAARAAVVVGARSAWAATEAAAWAAPTDWAARYDWWIAATDELLRLVRR